MDPISLTASIVTVLEAVGKAVNFLVTFKNASKEKAKLVDELQSTRKTLEDLAQLASSAENSGDPAAKSRLPALRRLTNVEPSPLTSCRKEIEALNASLAPPAWAQEGSKRGEVLHKVTWPFKDKDIWKVLERLARLRGEMALTLNVDQTSLTLTIHGNVQALADQTSMIDNEIRRKTIYEWLAAPDVSLKHHEACKKRAQSTGGWFVASQQYTEWRAEPNAFIWLRGIPGCGKTILSSTIIDNLHQDCKRNHGHTLAYFYHDFKSADSYHGKMLRSLVAQLSQQNPKSFTLLEDLYKSSDEGFRQPTDKALLTVLGEMILNSPTTYIVLDALDECKSRSDLLRAIETINVWQHDGLHTLVTSRQERDIGEMLEPLAQESSIINLQTSVVNEDIRTYVRSRLLLDGPFKKWQKRPEVLEEIETRLLKGADGMFRWAECQLDALQKCRTPAMLRKELDSLPSTLEETYARILCNIDESYSRLAIKALQWLVYSERPLKLRELVEVLAIDVEDDQPFDMDRRLTEHEDVIAICSSLVTITDRKMVQLVHFSVNEYLISESIVKGPAAMFAVDYLRAYTAIAEDCISYLVHIASDESFECHDSDKKYNAVPSVHAAFPLAWYALCSWDSHARTAGEKEERLVSLTQKLFSTQVFNAWGKLVRRARFDSFFDTRIVGIRLSPQETQSWLFAQAVESGLPKLVEYLLQTGCRAKLRGPNGWTPLQAAVGLRDSRMVKLLLDYGADVNVPAEGSHSPALTIAARLGDEEIAATLLRHGAYTDIVHHGTALTAAAKGGHDTVVRRLISEGANVNQVDTFDTETGGAPLQVAAFWGKGTIVRVLLEAGAYPNSTTGSALFNAARIGNTTIARLLLEYGAHANGENLKGNTALTAASHGGHDDIVQLLLDYGVDVNAIDGDDGSALQMASLRGHESTTQLLLTNGAQVNMEIGFLGTALQAASRFRREEVARLLLDSGARVQTTCGYSGDPLHAACESGEASIVKLLLQHGADVEARVGKYGSALQAAAFEGHVAVVQLLLNEEASINTHTGMYGTALQAAAFTGSTAVVQLLLDRGADVNQQGGEHGSAVQAAAYGSSRAVVKLLLDRGADVNQQDGKHGSALQAAAQGKSIDLVQLFLDRGADVNQQGGEQGSALQTAVYDGSTEVVQLLLDRGADVNWQGGKHGSALQIAVDAESLDMVKLLLDRGADINQQGGKHGSPLQGLLKARHNFRSLGLGYELALGIYDDIVRIMLDRGADMNPEGGIPEGVRQAVLAYGPEDVVRNLQERNKQLNIRDSTLQVLCLPGATC